MHDILCLANNLDSDVSYLIIGVDEIKCRSCVVQSFPSVESLERLAGAVMCEQDETWADKHHFSEAKMLELCDDKLKATGKQMDEMAEEEVQKVARQAIDRH